MRKRRWSAAIMTFGKKRDVQDLAKRTKNEMVRGVHINRNGPGHLLPINAPGRHEIPLTVGTVQSGPNFFPL